MLICTQKCGAEDRIFTTQKLSEALGMLRSNLSTLLNTLSAPQHVSPLEILSHIR